MTQNIRKIFRKLQDIEPSQELEEKVLKAIMLKNGGKMGRKLMFVHGGLTFSFSVLVYTLAVFGRAFLNSDFWNLAKLVFSDTGLIFSNFGLFLFSLLETLPIVEVFSMLVPIFFLMIVLSWYFKFADNNYFNHT